jgi:hypothetical protein
MPESPKDEHEANKNEDERQRVEHHDPDSVARNH